MNLPRWMRYVIYLSLFSVTFLGIIVHFTFETMLEHHLEPLFFINDTFDTVYVKMNSNFPTFWLRSEAKNQTWKERSVPISKINLKNCSEIPLELHGRVSLIKEPTPTFHDLQNEFRNSNLQNGHYQPPNCLPQSQIALIIPYRNRTEHLNIFLRNIHPFLQKQRLDYTIFVIEQAGNGPFNRGMLMNVGFVEAMNIRPFDCFIFHDVDLLPEDDRNLCTCAEQPRHLSVAVDTLKYKLPYVELFGGVSAMSAEHFQLVNGFSNTFWGWGGEDDDMSTRITTKGLHIVRYPPNIARYTMLKHQQAEKNSGRFKKLFRGLRRFRTDGLNSLEYQRLAVRPCKLFIWILVKLSTPLR